MTERAKISAPGVVIAVFIASVTIVFYVYGLPPFIAALVHRPVTIPMAEDYAVYSAFIEGFFSSDQPNRPHESINRESIVYVFSQTLPMKNPDSVVPLGVAVLGTDDMGEDFFRQNARSWPLQAQFNTSWKISLADRDLPDRAARARESSPEAPNVSGALQLSRVGFNGGKKLALLYYSYRCGLVCGRSGWVVLRKSTGNWQIQEFGSGVIY